MKPRHATPLLISALLIGLGGCSIDQFHRDSLRYSAKDRGTEVYELNPNWVFDKKKRGTEQGPITPKEAATALGEDQMKFYERYLAVQAGARPGQTIKDMSLRLSSDLSALHKQADLMLQRHSCKATTDKNSLETYERNVSDALSRAASLEELSKAAKPIDSPELLTALRTNLAQLGTEHETLKRQADTICANEPSLCTETADRKAVPFPLTDIEAFMPPTSHKTGAAGAVSAQTLAPYPQSGQSEVEKIWPSQILSGALQEETVTEYEAEKVKKVTVKKGLGEDFVRALSSTASVAQMRDLLTEPTFPALPPVRREVTLGCLPPPDQAAFTTSASLEALLSKIKQDAGDKKDEATAKAAFEYATQAQKMFEESERTVFLQYALFRLCEMSINAPSGFRNVYPVVVHDIVRRTAELREIETAAVQQRFIEESKTKAELAKVEQEKERQKAEEKRTAAAASEKLAQEARKAAEDAAKAREEASRTAVSDATLKSQQLLLDKRVDQVIVSCIEAAVPAEKRSMKDEVDKARIACEAIYAPVRKTATPEGS